MARRRAVEFNFDKAFAIIEALENNKEKAVTEAIEVSSKFVQKDLKEFAESKAKEPGNTGLFRKALKENPKVENNYGRIEMRLGFYKNKPHGMVAAYFNKGTPTTPRTRFIEKAFKNKKAIGAMNYVLGEYWRDGGKNYEKMKSSK